MTKPLFIFLIALSVRFTLFLFAASWQTEKLPDKLLHSDGLEYHKIAVNLATNGIFTTSDQSPFNPRLERVPLYPGYLAMIYKTGGIHPWLAILGQIFFSALTGVLIFYIGKQLFTPAIGFIAGLLFGMDFTSILISNMLLSDTLFLFFFLLHLHLFIHYIQHQNTSTPAHSSAILPKGKIFNLHSSVFFLLLSAFFLGLATLTHPVSIYFIVILIPFILWSHHSRLQKAILHLLLFTFTFLLLLTPWTLRHYKYKSELLLTSQQKEIFGWNTPRLKKSLGKIKSPAHVDANAPRDYTKNPEKNKYQQKDTNSKFSAAAADLLNYGRSTLRMLFVVSSTDLFKLLGVSFTAVPETHASKGLFKYLSSIIYKKHPFELLYIALAIIYLVILYTLALLGIFKMFRLKQYVAPLLFSGILFYFILAAAPAAFTAKYRLALLPIIMLSAAFSMTALRQQRRINTHSTDCPNNGITSPHKNPLPIPNER